MNSETLKNKAAGFVTTTNDALLGLFGLKVYKDSLLSTRIRTEMVAFCYVLTAQFIFDLWAWSRAFGFALPELPWLTPVFGAIFATGIVLVDRLIIVADISGSRTKLIPLFGRFILLLAICFITAIPVELSLFQGEIMSRIEGREKKIIDNMREKAIAKVLATAEQDSRVDVLSVREKQRAQLEDRLKLQLASLEKEFDAKIDRAAKEAAGVGDSGKYGNGPAFQAMQAQADDSRNRLDAFRLSTQEQLATFDAETEKVVAEKGKATAAAVEAIRKMPPNELADKFGDGEKWEQPRTLLARYDELQNMVEEDKSGTVGMFVWGARAVMVFFGLLVLMMKILASPENKHYYSFGAQTARGTETETVKIAEAIGHSDKDARKRLGWTIQGKDVHRNYYTAVDEVRTAIGGFLRFLDKAIEAKDNGLCLTALEIIKLLRDEWASKVEPVLSKFNKSCTNLEFAGFPIPPMPADLKELIGKPKPWHFSDEELEKLGWKDPASQVSEGQDALKSLIMWRQQVENFILSYYQRIHSVIKADPQISFENLAFQLEIPTYQIFIEKVVEYLRMIDDYEAKIAAGGMTVPSWKYSEQADTCWRLPSESTLKNTFGWQGRHTNQAPEIATEHPIKGTGGDGRKDHIEISDEFAPDGHDDETPPPEDSDFLGEDN